MKDCWVGMKALQGLVTFSITFPSVSLTWTTWPYSLIWKKLVVNCLMSTFSGAKISHKMGHSTLKGHPGNAGCTDTALLRTSGRSGGSGFQAWSCSHLRDWLCLWTFLVPGPGALCQCRQTRGPGSSCPDAAVSILPGPQRSAGPFPSKFCVFLRGPQPAALAVHTADWPVAAFSGFSASPDSLPYSLSCFLGSWLRYFTCSQTLSSGTALWCWNKTATVCRLRGELPANKCSKTSMWLVRKPRVGLSFLGKHRWGRHINASLLYFVEKPGDLWQS